MGITRQLYQLQALELEIDYQEQALAQSISQLGESQAVAGVRARLAQEKQRLEELKKGQHSAEWEIEDLETKLTAAKDALYSGQVKNPKELASLQHEVDSLKDRHDHLEEKTLDIMEQVELAQANLASLSSELSTMEAEWRVGQQKLSADIEYMKTTLSELKQKRQLALAGITPETIDFYNKLRKQKGVAVARVEQGTCCGCRISLSTAELQRARGDQIVQCTNCGRILFLD